MAALATKHLLGKSIVLRDGKVAQVVSKGKYLYYVQVVGESAMRVVWCFDIADDKAHQLAQTQ